MIYFLRHSDKFVIARMTPEDVSYYLTFLPGINILTLYELEILAKVFFQSLYRFHTKALVH